MENQEQKSQSVDTKYPFQLEPLVQPWRAVIDIPYTDLRAKFDEYFEGIVPELMRRYRETTSEAVRQYIEDFMTITRCPACGGARLRPESLAVKIGNKNISQITEFSIKAAHIFFQQLNCGQV